MDVPNMVRDPGVQDEEFSKTGLLLGTRWTAPEDDDLVQGPRNKVVTRATVSSASQGGETVECPRVKVFGQWFRTEQFLADVRTGRIEPDNDTAESFVRSVLQEGQ